MSTQPQFHLRWKGAVTGPFPLVRIQEMLRDGEISLLHGIEVNGRWTTVRDYFRATGLLRAPAAHEAAVEAATGGGTDHASAPAFAAEPSRDAAGEALERAVRSGYLWCGSTFLLPPLFSLLVVLLAVVFPETPKLSLFVLSCFTTAVGAFLPLFYVGRLGRLLDQEGLQEIRQAQSRLAWVLSLLSVLAWTVFSWVLTHPRP